MRVLKLGISALALDRQKSGGVERYVKNILGAIQDRSDVEIRVFANQRYGKVLRKELPGIAIEVLRGDPYHRQRRVLAEQTVLAWRVSHSNIDVLLAPTYTAPLLAKKPVVVTIHDVLFARFPEYLDLKKRLFWSISLPATARRADAILTISEFSKAEIGSLWGLSKPIVATGIGLDETWSQKCLEPRERRCGSPRKVILSVNSLAPHKRPLDALEVLARLRGRGHEAELRFVGRDNGMQGEVERSAAARDVLDVVSFLGFVEEEVLLREYRRADVLLVTSAYEGFCIPVLEGMSVGVPIVASRGGAIPEVLGAAGIKFEVGDVAQAAYEIERLWSDPRRCNDQIERGRQMAQRFSWKNVADTVVETCRMVTAPDQ